MFNHIDLRRTVTAGLGAAILSATCVAGAVSPAKAADLSPAAWQQNVNREIDEKMVMPSLRSPLDGHTVATLAVRFDEKGSFQRADIVKSSGNAAVDAAALRTAELVRYPALPIAAPRSVTMKLGYAGAGYEQAIERTPTAKAAAVRLASR